MEMSLIIVGLISAAGVAALLLSIRHDPPFWVVLVVALVTYPISTWLFGVMGPVGGGAWAEWAVRLSLISVVTALVSLLLRNRARGSADDRH
ncbi:hypothetical protein ETD86_01840 [Nonomuraea turkmeniaca]|uniref:Uncharacterized protein n=1 Tax=Nonomuraea turkmeniaca TaxID=103838 RepID=A0A5S4FWD3_9ACTN|nr:hypothetical protein [Nonomuraea turkmeniaca]TMR25115.1 hypothetical protein ETD86_01840 [Nonomuraea turkmeniaca]